LGHILYMAFFLRWNAYESGRLLLNASNETLGEYEFPRRTVGTRKSVGARAIQARNII